MNAEQRRGEWRREEGGMEGGRRGDEREKIMEGLGRRSPTLLVWH